MCNCDTLKTSIFRIVEDSPNNELQRAPWAGSGFGAYVGCLGGGGYHALLKLPTQHTVDDINPALL